MEDEMGLELNEKDPKKDLKDLKIYKNISMMTKAS